MTRIPIPYGKAYQLWTGDIWLAGLNVPARLRGRGIGTMIVQWLQHRGKPIVLEAVPDQGRRADLQRFYARLGFRRTKRANEMRWTPPLSPSAETAGRERLPLRTSGG